MVQDSMWWRLLLLAPVLKQVEQVGLVGQVGQVGLVGLTEL